ncbi:helix-turn-helix transcriptional regulator [Clostridium intestinale]|uniref:Helix-turn-helix transcriptional regulator n=1 Tax=Clostridium intestinale TaxID=36845 RepID=A0A7D7A6Q8_9CLOT|nr:helix-turn-helix transcriptional regulator [Clostridium intestinale]QLY82220.1 helix-turn-helix transcriptional regulator [Clostridium intestinale]
MNKKYKLKVKQYRILRGLTQIELAIKVGVSRNYISEVENNKYDIRTSLLYDLAEVLDVSLDELVVDFCDKCVIDIMNKKSKLGRRLKRWKIKR